MRRISSFYTPTLLLCFSIQIDSWVLHVAALHLWTPNPVFAAAPITPTRSEDTRRSVRGSNTLFNSSPTNAVAQIVSLRAAPARRRSQSDSTVSVNSIFGAGDITTFNIANFVQQSGLPPTGSQHPISWPRITGSGNNPTLSNIFGTIQTTGFGNANLFLMNPAGFLFGPNAT